jgi:hypothetical protein
VFQNAQDVDKINGGPPSRSDMPVHDWTRVYPGVFHDFHQTWITEIKRALNAGLLPPDYYAMAEQVAGGLVPDVLAPKGPPADLRSSAGSGEGGIALATRPPNAQFHAKSEIDQYAAKANSRAARKLSQLDCRPLPHMPQPIPRRVDELPNLFHPHGRR